MSRVRYERVGAAAVLTIDRPERRNAVDWETAEELHDGYRRFEADDEARMLVLTGAGDAAFCAGADLKAITEAAEAGIDPEQAAAWVERPEGPMGLVYVRTHRTT